MTKLECGLIVGGAILGAGALTAGGIVIGRKLYNDHKNLCKSKNKTKKALVTSANSIIAALNGKIKNAKARLKKAEKANDEEGIADIEEFIHRCEVCKKLLANKPGTEAENIDEIFTASEEEVAEIEEKLELEETEE